MNFNYDLTTWIDYFIGAFSCCLGVFFIGKMLLKEKNITIKKYSYIILIFLSILTIFNTLIFDNIFKVFFTFVIFFLIYKIIFRESVINSCLYAISNCICFIFSEIVISIITIIIQVIFNFNLIGETIKTSYINIIISLIAVGCAYIFRKKINNIIDRINKSSIFYIIVLGIISVIVMATSVFKLANNNWKIDYAFILNIFTFLGFLILTFVLLKQYLVNKEMTDKYILLEDYLKTSAELIEKYSSTVHKYKNNLIAIKGYLKADMKEAENYIDNLLDVYDNKKYNWFRKINYIQINSIRYVIYYKLSKAESENLKISVDVSNDIKEYNNELFTIKENNILLEILGEYFDNAIYASSCSKQKEINFMLYKQNKSLIFTISNSYEGTVDLSLICKNGYTTKGKNHGLGLYDVEKNVKNNDWIKTKYELIDNYFVVTLKINLEHKKTNKL